MEVIPCVQEASSHAASLLASLNLQRERAQFCDCVVRQRQNPGQLHLAHKCVLAASSPVLASILSCSGALVELQAPCLSDSVLALLLDYIYTGALPCTRSQHQYYNLLTAACHLQMDELQEALKAWQQTEVKDADTGAMNHQFSANVDTCDDICRTSSKNGANHCSRKDASNLSNVSACCSISESSVNTGNCRHVTHLTPQDLIQNISCTAEVHGKSGVDKEVLKDQFHSAGTEKLAKTVEDRKSLKLLCTSEVQVEESSRAEKRLYLSEEKETNRKEEDETQICHPQHVSPSQCSSSSSSSPHPSCGAVPVIRHSSRAAMLQLTEVPPMPPYHSVSQAAVSSNRAPDSRSGSTDSDSIVESITTRHYDHYVKHNQDYRNSSNPSDILKQDYYRSISFDTADHLARQNDKHISNGLSHITDRNDRHAHCDSFQNKNRTKHLRGDSMPQKKDCSIFADDFPSKHPRLDCSDCHNALISTAAEDQPIHSQDTRAAVPFPVQDSDTGSDSDCEDLSSEGEGREEHSYKRCPSETDRQDSHCDLTGEADCYPNLQRAETSTKDAAPSQHEHDSDNRDTAMTDKRHSVVCRPVSTTPESCLDSVASGLSGFERRTSVELEKISDIEITEPHLTFTSPVAHSMSDPTYSVVGPSYRGHLQYHCLPQEETHSSNGYSGRKHSHPSHPDHSDQTSDEEEVDPGYSPLRQHFAAGATDQVLLLDISAKPAALLVADAFRQKETFGNGFGNNDKEQWIEATSVACVDTKYWAGEMKNVEERKTVGKDQSRSGAEVKHKAGVEEGVSNPEESENQTLTLTVCSPPSVSDSVQASVSSTLSVCIPSTLSDGTPTNVSAHLPNPVHHPFQCSLCDRSFSQRGSLNRHVRSHLGVRPFPCPRCPMTFSRQYRVTEHMRVHQRCVIGRDFQQPPASSI